VIVTRTRRAARRGAASAWFDFVENFRPHEDRRAAARADRQAQGLLSVAAAVGIKVVEVGQNLAGPVAPIMADSAPT